ncbi:hypothetical protein HDV04_005416 [Boothiomyces sp. JEL0838]|nr:hypothetical protein HDV04_005416 [Boothiomyces sp. JEL0838]
MSIFQSIWNTANCKGVPDAFIIFNQSVGPPYFINNCGIGYCGMDNHPSVSGAGCCTSSVDLSQTNGIYSWQSTLLDHEWTKENAALPTANGFDYCKISTADSQAFTTNNTVYNTVNSLYLRYNGGCVNGVICGISSITFYQDNQCTVKIEQYPIQSNQSVFYNTMSFGNVSISLVQFSNGMNYIDWVTYVPGGELVPGISSGAEIFCLIAFILATVMSVLVLLHNLLLKSKKSTYLVIMATLTFFRTVSYFIYTYYVIPTALMLSIWTLTLDFLKISYMFGNFITCTQLNKMIKFHFIYFEYILFISVIFTWIGMQFLNFYTDILEIFPQWITSDSYFSTLMYFAYLTDNIYVCFVFIFDMSPIAYMFIQLIQTQVKKKNENRISIYELFWKYRFICSIFILQLFSVISYMVVNYLANETNLLGNDKLVLAITGLYILLQNLHNVLVLILYEYLKVITWELVNPNSENNTMEKPHFLRSNKSIKRGKSTKAKSTKSVQIEKTTFVEAKTIKM